MMIRNNTILMTVYNVIPASRDSRCMFTVPPFYTLILLDFSLYVKAATSIFISGCGSAISSAKEGKSGFIYNLVKS